MNPPTEPQSSMTDDAPRILTCLIEGESSVIRVELTGGMDAAQLRELIVKAREIILSKVDPDDITLWKIDMINPPPREELMRLVGRSISGSVELDDFDSIFGHWPATVPSQPPQLHVLVEVAFDRTKDRTVSPARSKTLEDRAGDHRAITIRAIAQGDFGGQDSIVSNHISELHGTEPDFLKDFRTRLGRRRWIEPETCSTVLRGELRESNLEFNDYFQDVLADLEQRDRVSGKNQLWHLTGAFLHEGWNAGDIKEDNVRWIFDPLSLYFKSVLGFRAKHGFRTDWPFKLIVTTESSDVDYRYCPRSGFHISVDQLVHFLVEVQSDKHQSDRYQMLLQGACAARLGRKIYKNPFVVVALYIENSGRMTRYFIFQLDPFDLEVYYVSEPYDWMRPSHLFTSIFELYNLASIIQDDRLEDREIPKRVRSLSSYVVKFFKKSFTSKRHGDSDSGEDGTEPAKRSRHGGQGGSEDLRDSEHVYYDRQVVDAFTRAGYTLKSNNKDKNGWAPLNRLKPTMRHAIQSSGTTVVVKLLRPGSNELRTLQHLHSTRSPYSHTIPLLGTLKLNAGTFILLPRATPLDLGFALGRFSNSVVEFSRQLIEGVGYLHSCDIAHLDIKPPNFVVLQNQLLIIDFDISVRVDGPDALIDRWCGTPDWMAPEIGHQDGPKCLYSPIRADLWSCGLMLRYLASNGVVKEENPFKTLTRQLLKKNPRLRPLLHPQSLVTVADPLSDLRGGLKRKPDTLPHVAKRLAVSSVHDNPS